MIWVARRDWGENGHVVLWSTVAAFDYRTWWQPRSYYGTIGGGLTSSLAVRYCVNLLLSENSQCRECYVIEGNQCCKLEREPTGTGHKIISRYCRRPSVSLASVVGGRNRQSTLRLATFRCVHRILFSSVSQRLYTNMIPQEWLTGRCPCCLPSVFSVHIA